jgi:nicotinamidase-related amidase
MPVESPLADLLAFLLAGRAERITQAVHSQMQPETKAGVGAVTDTVAALGYAVDPVTPSPALRDRILATFQARHAQQARTALLVCDMLVDHLTPGRPMEVPRARAIVPAVARRIAEARGAGVPVVFVCDRHAPDDPELAEWGAHAVEGSEGAEVWPELAPLPGDRIVAKPTYSAFTASSLEQVLDELRVDTVVLAGCATEVQLLTTATDALQRGFAVEVPPDTQAGNTEPGERFTLAILSALIPYAPARKARLERLAAQAA